MSGWKPLGGDRLERLVRLIAAAEILEAPVTPTQLRRLARSRGEPPAVRSRLSQLLRMAVEAEAVLYDERERVRRTGGYEAVRLYRVNWRHPDVRRILGTDR